MIRRSNKTRIGDRNHQNTQRHTGLTQVYYYQAKSYIETGELEVVLENYEIEPDPVVIAIPQGPRTPQKVNAFVDFAITELRRHF